MTTATRMRVGAVLVTVAAALVVGSFLPARAADGTKQVVRGHVDVPTLPRYAGPVLVMGCEMIDAVARWGTRANGAIAYRFDVDPATRGQQFVLTPKTPANLELLFVGGSRTAYVGPSVGALSGTVPLGADAGYVCLAAGGPTQFTYVATAS